MDNKNLSPETPKFKTYSFNTTCIPCGQSQLINVSDTDKKAARANAVQTFLFTHQCPKPGQRNASDILIFSSSTSGV